MVWYKNTKTQINIHEYEHTHSGRSHKGKVSSKAIHIQKIHNKKTYPPRNKTNKHMKAYENKSKTSKTVYYVQYLHNNKLTYLQ